jgi:hypothetical protein
MPILILNDILALHADALSSKLYPVRSGSLTRATELPLRLAATSTSRVHPRTRIRHLSDAFHKIRKSVSPLRISLKHVELRRGPGRKKTGTNYFQRSGQLIKKKKKKKKIKKINARQCSPAAHARLSRHPNFAWAGFGPLEHVG